MGCGLKHMELKEAEILVVKVGTSTLTYENGKVNLRRMEELCRTLSDLQNAGRKLVLVSSGAIGVGMGKLGLPQRPEETEKKQALAAVGQCELMFLYDKFFGEYGHTVAQVLLTADVVDFPRGRENVQNTFRELLSMGAIPVVNENDTVSVEQIRFGDNDTLAALVACLIDADLMVILSDIDGLYDANPHRVEGARLIGRVERIDQAVMDVAGEAGTTVGSGGMITKIKAARVLMAAGIPMVICNGRAPDAVVRAAEGEEMGTRFVAAARPHEITPKKLWIALGDAARGSVTVDEGAKDALVRRGSSLLCVGVVEGHFDAGDIVDIKDAEGHLFARGKAAFASDEVELACGRTREAMERNRLLAPLATRPLVHRDELIVFE